MKPPEFEKRHFRLYIVYIGLAVLFTSALNLVHGYFIDRSSDWLLHIMPTLAGIIFGYLISRIVILNQELGRLATIDTLTGACNRMQFDLFIAAEIDRAQRYDNRFSIIFMDIDHFKKVNDEHGHAIGDAVLRSFADIIHQTKRASDIFARYGGEEFVMLAHTPDMDQAMVCAERLRKRIEQHDFGKAGHLSCSFGVTEYRKDQDDAHSLMKRADDALYRAKQAGRNCVMKN